MAIADDISVDISGNFRWTGDAVTTYTVLAFHRYIGALMDDAQASGDDLLDITSETASERSTDQIITLNAPFNIDDTLAEHLYDGSISQSGGKTLYSGLSVVGTVEAGTQPIIIQDDKILPAYWGTGINADAANLIIMRILVKSRDGGADIDGKRIKVLAGELLDTYVEFPVKLGQANSVGAISTVDDINNNTADATIATWTDIALVEGFQLIDIDGNTTAEEYYQKWDEGTRSLNDVYEYAKWIRQRSHITDNGTDTGTDYVVDEGASIDGQGQEFVARATTEKLTEARFRLKIGAGTPVGLLVAELYDSDDATPRAPTGALLATSLPVLTSRLTTTYAETIFSFNDNVTLTASQTYFIVIRNVAADASNYVHVEGAAAGAHAGNLATGDGAGGWAGIAAADLWFTVKSSPVIHGRPGAKMRGVDYEVVYNTGSGTFQEDEILFWGTTITYDGLTGTFTVGEYVRFENAGSVVNGGKVLKDTGTVLTVALDSLSQNLLDGDAIYGISSGADALINTTITNDNKAGGEGVLLAIDDNAGTGDFYLQIISGGAPVDTLPVEGRTSGATAVVNVTVTSRPIAPLFFGQSTGTNLIGAYGIGFDTTDVGASDKFTDLTNTLRTPPNNVTMTVTGLVSGEDRILVGPRDIGELDKTQMSLSVTLNGVGETAVVVDSIPTETPTEGNTSNTRLRIQNDDGVFRRQAYDSYTGNTFVIPSSAYDGASGTANYLATSGNNVFVAYIDVLSGASSESFTAVYTSSRDLLLRVRDGGGTPIKTIENPITFGSSSFSTAIVRQSDA